MRILRIYNVSDYIHAGGSVKGNSVYKPAVFSDGVKMLPDGSWGHATLPVGGISFMLNPIIERVAQAKESEDEEILVFCVDDKPIFKRELYYQVLGDEMGYKATRPPKSASIQTQRDMIKDILGFFSPNVFFVEGYEADDIIATLCWHYADDFDKVYVHTLDSDLFCLVKNNIAIDKVGDRGKLITKDNWDGQVLDKNKYVIPYNRVLIHKLCYGDLSDNIPGVGANFYDKIGHDKDPYLTNISYARRAVAKASDNNPKVLGIFDLITPYDIYTVDPCSISSEPINTDLLFYIASLVGNKYMRRMSNYEHEDVKKVLDVFHYWTDVYYMRGGV